MIPYGRQDISQQDLDAVHEVLTSDFLTQGPAVPKFEAALAAHVGAAHGIACSNATAALHIACLALGLEQGDIGWTSPVTFVASANAIRYCAASVDFVDIDPRTYNMCAEALEAKLIQAEKDGCLPKVVIPVALCGQSCEMARISDLGKKYGFHVIEDASHAIGGRYRNTFVGGHDYADITVFSFHPVKIITTAEGGMATTQNARIAEKMRLLRSHGVTRDQAQMQSESHGPWYYEQIDLGFNYRMTDMQAALGYSQMQRLDSFVATRAKLASRYDALLADLPVNTPFEHPDT
ncbi:MAG: UDP-4-amino-4,6-dideoxy-N-acetyl-beta-L-altrosamine transaminase, partial [Paracoccaceae bacterium]|nr:UDP-4-amino-4,6-dideoxy-N-acetyl-beta-L-altrosamine transaminase [Paracoccaceae bacterium]